MLNKVLKMEGYEFMSMILGNRIRKARKLKAMSYVELSAKTRIPKDRIKMIERGQESISVGDLNLICKAIGIKREQIFIDD